jgi:hypothetical protein
MVLAIEPMVNAGGYEVEIKEDGWTAITKDGSLAHFEHSVAVTKTARLFKQIIVVFIQSRSPKVGMPKEDAIEVTGKVLETYPTRCSSGAG